MGQDKGLAQATKIVHAGFADDSTTAVTSSVGTFSYTYAGQTYNVTVIPGHTLSQLVEDINSDPTNPGVTASIINDGQGLPDSYKLVLTGQDIGAQYQITAISHDLDNFDNGGEVGGGFTRAQWATNAMVKVDGYPSEADIYLQRSSNQIDDVISGVTLDLHDAGEAVVTVSTDTEAIYAKIEALVNAVNYTQTYIRQETYYDPDGEETGILIGNYSYYILKSRIDSALNTGVSGLVDGTDTYTHLTQIGIHTDPDAEGAWVIDSATLRSALNSDPEAVANLFIENTTKGSTGVAKRTHSEMVALTDNDSGTLNVLIDNYTDIIENIDEKIEREEKRLTLYRQRLTERFARLESILGELNAEATALESAIKQLPNGNGS
jgi:flagellar hook-associated protein 2